MDTETKGLYQITGSNGTILLGYTDNRNVVYMLVFDAQHLPAATKFMRNAVKTLANLSMHNPKSMRRNVVEIDDIHGVCGRSIIELIQDGENLRIRLIRGLFREYEVTFEQLMFLLDNSMSCLQPVRLNSAFMACNECEMCTAQ